MLRLPPHLLLMLACGCALPKASTATQTSEVSAETEKRDVEIAHEDCPLTSSQAQSLDANLDGRPEIVTVFDGGRPICRAVDINLDGIIDVFIYFDPTGQPRRRESGFDRDTTPDEISHFQAGVLIRKERETNNDGKLDTWDYYENNRLVREERDSTGDGYVNQWWTFTDPKRPECAVVVSDLNADTKPDPESRMDTCAVEGAPQPPSAASASPTAPSNPTAPPATQPPTPAPPQPPSGVSPPPGASLPGGAS